MAHNCRSVPAHIETVFEYLLDPSCYPRWLIGTDRIRATDPQWPQPGARFHHTVGFPPVKISDHSEVLEVDAPNLLRLSVHASTLVRGIVTFTLRGDADETILCIEEEPERRLVGNLLRPLLDPITHVRNHNSLRRFARMVAEEEAARRASATGEG